MIDHYPGSNLSSNLKIPAPIITLALPLPLPFQHNPEPPLPLKRGILGGMGVFQQKEPKKIPGAHITDMRLLWTNAHTNEMSHRSSQPLWSMEWPCEGGGLGPAARLRWACCITWACPVVVLKNAKSPIDGFCSCQSSHSWPCCCLWC